MAVQVCGSTSVWQYKCVEGCSGCGSTSVWMVVVDVAVRVHVEGCSGCGSTSVQWMWQYECVDVDGCSGCGSDKVQSTLPF